VLIAAALSAAWALSLQFEGPWLGGPNWYSSFLDGGFGVWRWLPTERESIEFGPHSTPRTLSGRPFFWIDSWGYGFGIPFWPLAILAVGWATWRYAFGATRQLPPGSRVARRLAAAALLIAGATLFGLVASARHRTCNLLGTMGTNLTFQNGALVLAKTPVGSFTMAVNPASSRIRFGTGPTAAIGVPTLAVAENRQGPWLIDVFPDVHTATGNWRYSVPLWALALITGATAWRLLTIASRRSIGLCVGCGYPLDGLASGAPCPECGRARPAPKHPPSETAPSA